MKNTAISPKFYEDMFAIIAVEVLIRWATENAPPEVQDLIHANDCIASYLRSVARGLDPAPPTAEETARWLASLYKVAEDVGYDIRLH